MPITLSYDLQDVDTNQRSYVRSTLERFGWLRLGGSVFRYKGRAQEDGEVIEDWLNDVVPALMYVRSYVLSIGGKFRFLTIDAMSTSTLMDTDDEAVGTPLEDGAALTMRNPANAQSSEQRIRAFVEASIGASTLGL
jgi:hypothetical protein